MHGLQGAESFGLKAHVTGQPKKGRVQDSLIHGQSGKKHVLLVDKANDAFEVRVADLSAVHSGFACNRAALVLACQNVEERGLSSTGSTHNGQDLTGLDGTRHTRQDLAACNCVGDVVEPKCRRDVVGHDFVGLPSIAGVLSAPKKDGASAKTEASLARATQVPKQEGKEEEHSDGGCDADGDQAAVVRCWRRRKAWDLRVVNAFASVTAKSDIAIAEDVVDEAIHSGL